MHWDRMFEDLEGQLAAEWEAERAVLDAESERLRISKLSLRARLRALAQAEASVGIRLRGGLRRTVRITMMGADWFAVRETTDRQVMIVPLSALTTVATDHGALLGSLAEDTASVEDVRGRMSFGFLLRDLARRRVPVHLTLIDGDLVHGTIDRAGEDHLDIAVHDAGQARRASAVSAFHMVPFEAVVLLRADARIT
ncbi:hypothetical protein [uncultured Microbacterium sp.]|uniref:hypothetical protein n=1 Tax=uncultured Microbacterium sp. TaxID=191216 RepID=UPI00263149EB|nr:hypothetical protein [uncultured Microbacterium sp.]